MFRCYFSRDRMQPQIQIIVFVMCVGDKCTSKGAAKKNKRQRAYIRTNKVNGNNHGKIKMHVERTSTSPTPACSIQPVMAVPYVIFLLRRHIRSKYCVSQPTSCTYIVISLLIGSHFSMLCSLCPGFMLKILICRYQGQMRPVDRILEIWGKGCDEAEAAPRSLDERGGGVFWGRKLGGWLVFKTVP